MSGEYGFVGQQDRTADGALHDGEQLSLTEEDDVRLPWLESSDYDDDQSGFARTRALGLLVLAGLVILAVAGAAWWYFSDALGSDDLQAEGTTIAAPEGPYKVRPSDPGGKVFEGTGDTSFAVGEGETRESRLAARPALTPTPTPTQASTPDASSSAAPSDRVSSGPVADDAGGVNVQVGAYATRTDAQAGWQTLRRQTEKLNGVKHRIVVGQADIGTVYRLQALPGDLAAAKRLCADLKTDGVACTVKR